MLRLLWNRELSESMITCDNNNHLCMVVIVVINCTFKSLSDKFTRFDNLKRVEFVFVWSINKMIRAAHEELPFGGVYNRLEVSIAFTGDVCKPGGIDN